MKVASIDIQNHSGEQAILIPKDMHIDDDKVFLKKVGNAIHIIPYHNPWQNLIEGTAAFTDDFMENRNQPGKQNRETLD